MKNTDKQCYLCGNPIKTTWMLKRRGGSAVWGVYCSKRCAIYDKWGPALGEHVAMKLKGQK